MKLEVLHLKEPVTVTGHSLFGWASSHITLSPGSSVLPYSWIYRHGAQNIRVDPSNISCAAPNNVALLKSGKTIAHTLEHLTPLRTAGLLGVTITNVSHCLPYSGGTLDFWNAVIPKCVVKTLDVPVRTVSREIRWNYPHRRSGHKAFTSISPRTDGKLVLEVTVAYPGLGELGRRFTLPDNRVFGEIIPYKAQGWPPKRYGVSKLTQKMGLWRHHKNVVWPQEVSKEEALESFWRHRCVDLLGALGILMEGGWLSANVKSVCSGHQMDIKAIKEAYPHAMVQIGK